MTTRDWTYDLHVFGTKPKDLPMEDFGEIVKRFADLLGSPDHVRFVRLSPGSAACLAEVLEPARQRVHLELIQAKQDGGAARVKADKLDVVLRQKGLHAELRDRQGAVILTFPGVKKQTVAPRTVQRMDTITGVVIKIGGRDDTVPMQLQVADAYLDVNVRGRELARELAQLLFQEVRVSGLATWKRDEDGTWACTGMVVDSFDRPDFTPLADTFKEIAGFEGNEWADMDEPDEVWLAERRGEQ